MNKSKGKYGTLGDLIHMAEGAKTRSSCFFQMWSMMQKHHQQAHVEGIFNTIAPFSIIGNLEIRVS